MSRSTVFALLAAAVLGMPAAAQDLGTIEFMNSCAQCHGIDGKGDGPVTPHLLTPPPDLTVLSQMNGGVFPIADVYSIIDGTADVAVHGGRDMPVWGETFEVVGDTKEEAEQRIRQLAHYVWMLQAD